MMAKKAKQLPTRKATKKATKKAKTGTTNKAAAKRTERAKPVARGAAKKHVYFFGNGQADGDRTMKDLLGGKGSGLAEMTNAGLPVPPGFTISTEVCNIYYKENRRIPEAID